jgi:GAF domain-containing protein
VATAPFVTEIDDIQYEMGQGPCISAAREGRTVLSVSLGGDLRWPRFGGRIARLGVHSVMSLPLITPDGVVGAMNIYAHGKNAFDERAAELGQIFAAPAAIAVQNAHVLAQTQRLANQLQSALELRGVIDRAVGILMSRSGSTEHEALERLRTMSQHEHRKLGEVARLIVDEAVARGASPPEPTKSRTVLIRRRYHPRVQSLLTRLSDSPVRAAAASGFGAFAEPVHADTISGRIRFLGARVWTFQVLYSRTFKISRRASDTVIGI